MNGIGGIGKLNPLGGYDPYASSKACSEFVTFAYRNSFFNSLNYDEHGVAIASVRAGNVIGGGDWAKDRLIPDIIRSLQKCEPVKIRSPYAVRPWQHVLEPLSGYIILAEKLFSEGVKFAEAWNFGPDNEDAQSVQRVVETIVSLWGAGARWVIETEPQMHEAHTLKLDCSKSKVKLGWHPCWSLDKSLKHVVSWYKAMHDNQDMWKVTIQEIEMYSLKN